MEDFAFRLFVCHFEKPMTWHFTPAALKFLYSQRGRASPNRPRKNFRQGPIVICGAFGGSSGGVVAVAVLPSTSLRALASAT